MELIRVFEGLGKHDASIAGGKGASLGEMTQAGIPVPGGFVVLSSAFEQFLEETDLNVEIDSILHSVDTKAMHTIEHASETIQKLILEAKMPKDIATLVGTSFTSLNSPFVAVRSSATAEDSASAAWAGQLDSFLNTTEATLLENVQRCWASLFTPRAIFYRFEQGLHESKISVAVVVQKMVESEVSGIAFSVHPVTEDRNQLIIEAGFGLGEAIVSGQVTPDSYVVGKSPREIIDINVSTQTRALYRVDEAGGNEWRDITEPKASSQVLTEAQILELSALIIHIENHYGFPCDIEWAYEAGKFYIVQSRPITTLQQTTQISTGTKPRMLTIFGHRDFTLGLLEVGLDAESLPLLHLDKQEQTRPYFIAERKNNKDILFIDLAQVERQKEEIYAREVRDVNYIRMILKETEEVCEPILQLLYNPRALSRDEIQVFIPQLRTAWRWYAGLWWAIERIEKDDTFAAIIKETMVFRKKTEKFVPGADDVVRKTIMGLCPTLEKYKEVILLSEVLEDTVPDVSVLEERNTHCLLVDGSVYIGDKIEYILKQCNIALVLHEAAADYSREFCGHIAYRGKYRGMVTLVFTKEQASAFPQGNVLVVSSSTPDLLPAIQKSGAIIADEGGIMSHAAIISRELGVPCIIGTKFATEILKDGDLVEVDADNGVVRVLERASENKVVAANAYLGEVDLSSPNTLERLFTREIPLFSFSLWHTDILEYQEPWLGRKIINNMLILSDGHDAKRAGIYYLNQELVGAFAALQERVLTEPNFFNDRERDFIMSLEALEPALEALKQNPTKETLEKCIDLYFKWYYINVSTMHSIVDLIGIPDDIRNRALALRERTQELDADFGNIVVSALEKIYPQYQHLLYYILPEELHLLEGGISAEKESEICSRKNGWFFLNGRFFSGHDILQNELNVEGLLLASKSSEHAPEIRGSIAVKGCVQGVVRVIHLKKDLETLLDGEVLIATMTSPEYVPAMKKAVAIVTDEGGITCHAAIVSRELKKPCIIGTKIATQVLKDGDLVEVDADKGVVRVIERKEDKLYEGDWVTMKSSISPLIIGYNVDSWVDVSVSRYGTYAPLKKMLALVKDSGNIGAVAVLKNDYISSAQYLLGHRETLDSIFKDFEHDEEKFIVLLEALENRTRDIKENFDAFLDAYNAMYSSGIMFDGFLMYSDTLVEQIKQNHSQSLDEDIRTLTKTPGLTFSQKEEYGIIRIALASEAEQENLLSAHAKRFHWVLNNYKNVSRIPESYFKERIAGLRALQQDVLEAKHKECEEYERVHEEAVTAVRAKNVLSKEAIETLLLLGKIGWYVDRRKALNLAGNYWIGEYISRTCTQYGIREKDALLLLPEEFTAVVSGQVSISDFHLEERQNEFGMVFGHGSHRAVLGSELIELKNVIEPKVDIEISELKGNVAYRGIVRGKVRVLNFVNEKSFEENEVLVTSMTRPDFVPLMKKACAIVTDEGGVTSHAAIVARELKKPCIIGTKIATQVLKDGDLVEVDADNGVVKILENNNYIDEISIIERIKANKWEKNFQGKWLLYECCYYGKHITETLRKTYETGPSGSIFIIREGISTHYLIPTEIEDLNTVLRERIVNNTHEIEKWINNVRELIHEIRALFDDLQKRKTSLSDLESSWETLGRYYVANFPFKKLLDSMDEAFQKEWMQSFSEIRASGEFIYGEYPEIVTKVLTGLHIAKKPETIPYALPEEMERALSTNTNLDQTELDERMRKCALVFIDGQRFLLKGRSVDTIEKVITDAFFPEASNVLRGTVAYSGRVTGIVRVVRNPNIVTHYPENAVLVTGMTRPEYLPFMQKSIAIVTDAGGILSHAAISARELDIPCIVGTQIATQVLQDGDLVEVDADNGVVRVIKKAK